MKKAKRLLAVLLAAVMIMTAAYLPSYAYTEANKYNPPSTSNIGTYYMTYEQSAGYLLDILDALLKEANLYLIIDDLDRLIGVDIFEANALIDMDQFLADAKVTPNYAAQFGFTVTGIEGDKGYVDLRCVDLAIRSIYGLADCLANKGIVDFLGNKLGLLGDLVDPDKGLARLWPWASLDYQRGSVDDTLVLEYLVQLVANGLGPVLRNLLGGQFDVGSLLEGTLNDLVADLLGPRASLSNIGIGVKDLLYSLLINSEAEIMNGDNADGTQVNELDDPDTPEVERVETVDDMVQQLIDWALIDGTGEYIYNGGNSMLGKNAEALLPALGSEELKKAGGADIGATSIQSDRDLDGALENNTMSFYQLVANVLQALLGGMLTPMLTDLIVDLVGIEITEEAPFGDSSITTDMMYGMLLGSVTRDASTGEITSTAGAIENLLVSNGAPQLIIGNYDSQELPVDTPVGHVTAVVKWFLDDGGLDALIKIDYQGIHIQDNFMSLLNDIARLAINLLPGLGVFDGGDLVYTADQLNEYYAYDAEMNIVNGADEAAIDSLYLTYETGELVYVDTYTENPDGSKTPSIYCYYDGGDIVNTTKPNEAKYINPSFIRQYYVISTDQVYACIIKLLLDSLIEGCYFPEWADTIPSVLAYGLASLASPLVPENNYFARLDAYAYQENLIKVSDKFENGVNVTPIPYTVEKEITVKDPDGAYTKTITVPQAALDIGCSYLAAYLNAVLDINDDEKLDTDTSLEKFAGEFLVWGFTNYLPMFTGKMQDGVLKNYFYNGITVGETKEANMTLEEGIFQADVNAYLGATYEDWETRVPLSDDDNDVAYDAIYTLLDETLFRLIPTSWLPDIHGSQQLVLDWLLGNLCEFDLQGILGLLSVNMDASAELNLPVIQVLLRVIDRVLALVFNDHALLLNTDRRPITGTYSEPSVTTLDGLLDCSSPEAALPTLVYQLLMNLNTFKRPLLATLLPLILGANYERPFDTAYLGTDNGMATYKVADLENYMDRLTQHVNASFLKSMTNEEDAAAACDGKAISVRNVDGTYSIKLSNESIFNTYPSSDSAARDLELLEDAYYVAVESDEVDEVTGEPIIASYDVYYRRGYMTTAATVNTATDTTVEYGQQRYDYTDFVYASFYPRGKMYGDFVGYDYAYRTFEPEDFHGKEYYYTNANNAIESAQEYIGTYKSFAENDLPAAYGDWLMFSVETKLRTNDIWDTNGDGYSVRDDSDGDRNYTDASGNAATRDVDGEPSMPGSMYPFKTTAATAFTFYDEMTATDITTETMNLFDTANYEQIALALEYGNDRDNDVALSESQAESVIRLALYPTLGTGALQFDITYNGDNAYNGNLQWNTLTDAHWAQINTWLAENDEFRVEENLDENGAGTGTYTVYRTAFRQIDAADTSFTISTPAIAIGTTPAHPTHSDLTAAKGVRMLDTKSDYQQAVIDLHNAYKDYITALYQNRRSLYNTMDYVGFRLESAEAVRSVPMEGNNDLVVLDWALDYAYDYYMFDSGRNYMPTGNIISTENGNVEEVTKVYTATSFEVLQRAYDYAQSLRKAIVSNASANEVTQSMVTAAYQAIIYAVRQLVPFTGDADWTQLDYYRAIAKEILEDENNTDDILGIASGLDALEDIYNDAEILRADGTVDCEKQHLVDNQASALNTAIQNLVYNTVPSVRPTDPDATENANTITVSNVNNRIVGHVFGLEEGTGITDEMFGENGELTIAGMTLDSAIGSDVSVSPSGRGNGTGSYIIGRVRTLEKFRYFAVVYGDLNGDTRIDGSDASYVQYYIANGKNNETDMGHVLYVAADTNHDNVVDASDVKYIQNHYTFAEVDANGDGVINDKDKITQTEHRVESAQ